MAKAQPADSYGSGGDRGGANTSGVLDDLEAETNEYGDEGFESVEDLSPARRGSGDELRQNGGKGTEDSGKDIALPAFDNSSDPAMELEVPRWKADSDAHAAHLQLYNWRRRLICVSSAELQMTCAMLSFKPGHVKLQPRTAKHTVTQMKQRTEQRSTTCARI